MSERVSDQHGLLFCCPPKDGVFNLYSHGCKRCDHELQIFTCTGVCDMRCKARESTGWQSMFRRGSLQQHSQHSLRQQLMEVKHSKAAMNSSAMAHVMEVTLPGLYKSHGEDKCDNDCSVVWCPRTPRVKGATDSIELKTKLPKWNPKTRSMVLDFAGRVKKASARNFQLCIEGVGCDGEVFLQYGKVKKGLYALDFRHPLSPLQALGVALSVKSWQ